MISMMLQELLCKFYSSQQPNDVDIINTPILHMNKLKH